MNDDLQFPPRTDVERQARLGAVAGSEKEGGSSNTPSPETTTTGGEDWLTVSLHVNHGAFDELSERLDKAQHAAKLELTSNDEDVVHYGNTRFNVSAKGASRGSGEKAAPMKWRLNGGNGITLLLMNRDRSHHSLANVAAIVPSTTLMREGFANAWAEIQYCLETMGAELVEDKVSRVDSCVDLPNVPVETFTEPFRKRWIVGRRRRIAEYYEGTRPTGFTCGPVRKFVFASKGWLLAVC